MITPEEIVLPETDDTRCGKIAERLNPDIDWSRPINFFSQPQDGPLTVEQCQEIGKLLDTHNKIMIEVNVAGYFDHTFTLFNTTEGVYIADSYIYQRTVGKRPLDLKKLYEMLVSVSKCVGKYETCRVYNHRSKSWKTTECTSIETFGECEKVWHTFWGTKPIDGSQCRLNYYWIRVYKPAEKKIKYNIEYIQNTIQW